MHSKLAATMYFLAASSASAAEQSIVNVAERSQQTKWSAALSQYPDFSMGLHLSPGGNPGIRGKPLRVVIAVWCKVNRRADHLFEA